jgi:hypothetical protein
MTRVTRAWERFWFEPESPSNLGLCRALFYGLILMLYLFDDVSAWGGVSKGFWFPTPFFQKLGVPVLGESALLAMDCVWKLALAAACVGIVTRPAAIVAFVVALYRLGLPHNFGKVHHFDAMVVFVLGVLACARTSDAWSLDRRLAARRTGAAPAVVEASGEYRWPVRAVWLIMSLAFFAAGFQKLRHGGLAWIVSDNMSVVLAQHAYRIANADPPVDWGLVLSHYPLLCSLLALATIVVEAGYPLSLFNRYARWFFPPAMCATLVGIRLFMGPTFPEFVICHLFWIPWDRVLEAVGAWRRRLERSAVASATSAH